MPALILVAVPGFPHPPYTGAHSRPPSLIRAPARHHEVVVAGCVVARDVPPIQRRARRAADSAARAAAAPEGA